MKRFTYYSVENSSFEVTQETSFACNRQKKKEKKEELTTKEINSFKMYLNTVLD